MQQRTFEESAASKVDPDRWMSTRTTGQKLSGVIGMILGGIAGGFTGKENPVFGIIDKAIEKDIEQQRGDKKTKDSRFNFYVDQGRSLRDAHNLAKADLLDSYRGNLAAAATKFGGEKAMLTAKEADAAIAGQALKLRQDATDGKFAQQVQRSQLGLQAAQIAAQREAAQATREAATTKATGIDPKVMVKLDNGKFAEATDPESKKKADAVFMTARKFSPAIAQYKALLKANDLFPGVNASKGARQTSATTDAVYENLIQQAKSLFELGSMTPDERKQMQGLIPRPGLISSGSSEYAKLDALQGMVDKFSEAALKTYLR
jgi:hypothetical protein